MCLAFFLLKKRKLTDMMLMGNALPWVSSIKHLGVKVEDNIDSCQSNMMIKSARLIKKNIDGGYEVSSLGRNAST